MTVTVTRVGVAELGRAEALRLLRFLGVEMPDLSRGVTPVTIPLGDGGGFSAAVSKSKLIVRREGGEVVVPLDEHLARWYTLAQPARGEVVVWPLPGSAKLYIRLSREVNPARPEPAQSLFAIITPEEEGGVAVDYLKVNYLSYRREVYTISNLRRAVEQQPEMEGRERLAAAMKVELASPSKIIGLHAATKIKGLARSLSLKPYAIVVDEDAEGYSARDVAEALLWEGVYCEVREPPRTCLCGGPLIREGELARCASCGFTTYRTHLILHDAVRLFPPFPIAPPPKIQPIKTLKAVREVPLQLPEPLKPTTVPLLWEVTGEPPYAYIENGALHIVLGDGSTAVPLPPEAEALLEGPPISWGVLATPGKVIITEKWVTLYLMREWYLERPDPRKCVLAVIDVHPGLLVAHYYDTAQRKQLKRWQHIPGEEPPDIEKAADHPVVSRILHQLGGSWRRDPSAAVALAIVLKLISYAASRGLTPYAIIDAPGERALRGSWAHEVMECLRDWLEWHGIWYEEQRLLSSICPICGNRLEGDAERKCRCGFRAEKHTVPLYWALRLLNLPLK